MGNDWGGKGGGDVIEVIKLNATFKLELLVIKICALIVQILSEISPIISFSCYKHSY